MKDRLIIILGPTAVGKTDLALALAEELGTEIISGDSMLVYQGFNIGSAKPTREELSRVKHHLIDICSPDEGYCVTDFVESARRLIKELNAQGKVPILAGGTGLYVKALLEGYEFNEESAHEEYRLSLERLAEERGKEYVHGLLEAADPETAARLHVNDFRRVVRALEVASFGGETVSTKRATGGDGLNGSPYDALVIGLSRDRAELYERINRRVELMFEAGLESEVSSLLVSGIPRTAQAMQGIGYKETAAYLASEITLDEAKELIKKSTRHFAKRQLTWYRKMPYIKWLEANRSAEELLADCRTLIKVWEDKQNG